MGCLCRRPVCRFHRLLKKHGVGYVQASRPSERVSSLSTCKTNPPGARRPESAVVNHSDQQHVDTTRYYVSSPPLRHEPRSSRARSTSPECSPDVDEDAIAVDWTWLRLVFVLLDILLLTHRLTRLYVELSQMRLATPTVGQFWPMPDGCAEGRSISILPVDGVDPAQTTSGTGPALNHIGSEDHGSGDDDNEADVAGSTANATDRCCSNCVSSTPRRRAAGSRSARRRRARSSTDIVPRLVCLVALLAALFYVRTSTMSRGVLWLHDALPSVEGTSPSISPSAVGSHFYDDIGIASMSSDFRQLQAFVDFFNSGKSMDILTTPFQLGLTS